MQKSETRPVGMEMKQASWYTKLADSKVRCDLCPHVCVIKPGETGKCRVRENQNGELAALTWGRVTSTSMDPIEKKPLYHFHPGSPIYSLGTVGCNFTCNFCQNWEISQGDVPTAELAPDDAVKAAKRYGSHGIAYTYNEPLIWFEYIADTARIAHEAGLYNVLVTNGFINEEPFREMLPLIDALNIDLKSINNDFYKRLCGGKIKPVLASAKLAKENSLLEVTNLIIPGENDSEDDLTGLADWIADELGGDTPVHLSAYFPRYKLQRPPTSPRILETAYDIFKKRLDYVYLGNMHTTMGSDTDCASCGATLIERSGYSTKAVGLDGNKCARCGAENNIMA